MAKSVLPQPALPQIKVGLPLGKPPPVISSTPGIPVGDLGSSFTRCFVRFIGAMLLLSVSEGAVMKFPAKLRISFRLL